jgi:predicted TIM-barrel fold metal-dependent hydrolase
VITSQRDGIDPMGANVTPASVIDVDSHEMVPIGMWPEIFGDEAAPYVEPFQKMWLFNNAADNVMNRADLIADDVEITYDTVWNLKGPSAPSAIDVRRRPAVLDAMGIARQLVYPTMGTIGYLLLTDPTVDKYFGFDRADLDCDEAGHTLVDLHNRWVGRVTTEMDGRVRPVAVLLADDLAQMMSSVEGLLANGVRAVMIPGGTPPAGMSPADKRLDPLWLLLAGADVPVLHHVTAERGFLHTTVWAEDVPEFRTSINSTAEFHIEPWRATTLHFASENYLTAMILGGVFERHPELRFGVAELTAGWIGPFAERLDDVVEQFSPRYASFSMLPSERVRSNIRVAPFPYEPVDRYFDAYPLTRDVICYGSDFPHKEGGRESKELFLERIGSFGDTVVGKFFRTNGEWLVPD